ncbi:hypothetical protein [uncultured Prevotella sp.]|uniref:hypothetical protein n=1 Tax=uncultured Prevotella sp. TaxID=159272 RepID=UPI0025988603|nr:hypothetical protein [uncultured Prevotella sp.]
MGKIRNVTLWLMAVITFMSCAATRRVEQGSSEQRRDSTVAIVKDSVTKSETRTDSSAVTVTDENHTSGTMTDKGSNEETITERVTESTDAQGNKTTTTDRTIHRRGDYERNASYEARLKHQEEIIMRMQHTIDSLVLSNKLNVGTHWAKKDSTNVVKEKNTKDIKPDLTTKIIAIFLLWIVFIVFVVWFHKNDIKHE